MDYFGFVALLLFIIASLLGLIRAWRAFNLENIKYGKLEISFIQYFFHHLDDLVLNIVPINARIDNETYKKRRKQLNNITYTIYALYILSIGFFILK